MLKLWGRANSSNVQKVLWTCDELGLAYERIDAGGPFGRTDEPSYRAMNPNGRVPTIDDDGFVLWESNAIMRYLAGGDPTRRLLPTGRRAAADADKWLDWQMATLGLSLRDLFMALARPDGSDGASVAVAADATAGLFAILDRHLQRAAYTVGESFTIADIALGVSTHRWLRLPVERPRMPGLERWYDRISGRPGFGQVATIPVR
jgi:glutathione S-transferase